MRNIKRAPYQNKIKKISNFAKPYILEITPNYEAKLQKKNCSFSSFATRVIANFAQAGRVKLGQSALIKLDQQKKHFVVTFLF